MKDLVSNIKNQEFTKTFRGYNTEEIDSYLDQLSYEFEKILTKKLKLELQVKELAEENEKSKIKIEELLIESEQLKSDAAAVIEATKTESAIVLKEAQMKAGKIIIDAKKDADKIRNSVINLREEKGLLIARIKAIINTQIEILDTQNGKNFVAPKEKSDTQASSEKEINVEDIVEKLL